MQFLVKAYDGEGMLEKRVEVRPRHLEGMKVLGKQIICAGGLLDDEGNVRERGLSGTAVIVTVLIHLKIDVCFRLLTHWFLPP